MSDFNEMRRVLVDEEKQLSDLKEDIECLDDWIQFKDEDSKDVFDLNIHGDNKGNVLFTIYKRYFNKDGSSDDTVEHILKQTYESSKQLNDIFKKLNKENDNE